MLGVKAKIIVKNLQPLVVILKHFFEDVWEILEITAIIGWYTLSILLANQIHMFGLKADIYVL